MTSVTIRPTESSSLSRFYRCVFADIKRSYPDTFLAEAYILARLNAEGIRFATSTLPLLGKAIDISLTTHEPIKVPCEFRKRKGTELPQLMYDIFKDIYKDNGELRFSWDEALTDAQFRALLLLRTVCLSFSKVVTSLEKEITDKSLESFSKRISKEPNINTSQSSNNDAIREARRLLRLVFDSEYSVRLREFIHEPWGRHGPGAVAGRESGASKWSFEKWPGLDTRIFAYNENISLLCNKTRTKQPRARAMAVPKDFRGPRIICIEPKENQFAQQGLLDCLMELCSSHPLTSRSINFQSVERQTQLCYRRDSVATLDLKDASDNLSLRLARILLPRWVFKLVTRYRTRFVEISGKEIKNNAFATMGSAVCFPIQTMIFWALSLGTMISIRDAYRPKKPNGRRATNFERNKALPFHLSVFGDDIICSLWAADEIMRTLEACGLIINKEKTCVFSALRESCGAWVIAERPVSIVRFKSTHISTWRDYVRWLDYYHESDYGPVKEYILDELKAYTTLKKRVCRNLQRVEVRLPTLCQSGRRSTLPDYIGLYAYFVRNNVAPSSYGTRKRVKWSWKDAKLFEFLE